MATRTIIIPYLSQLCMKSDRLTIHQILNLIFVSGQIQLTQEIVRSVMGFIQNSLIFLRTR